MSDPYQKPEGYVAPDLKKTGVGVWIFAAVLVVLAVGGYLFYQKGSDEIDHMKQSTYELCLQQHTHIGFNDNFTGYETKPPTSAEMRECRG